MLGRNFATAEDQPGAGRVVIVGYDFWRQHLDGRADGIGQTITLDGMPYTVIGVMPKTFRHPYHAQVWLPLRLDYSTERSRHNFLYGVARLRQGISFPQAEARDQPPLRRDQTGCA